jgi:methionine sulfoxide reductase heme-binding subunit
LNPWFLARASGLLAYALFAVSTIAGVLLSSKFLGKKASKPLTLIHEALSVSGLFTLFVHMLAILKDTFFKFGVGGVLVPGLSPYAPLAVGVGVVAAWLSAIVVASFYVRKKIGPRNWRRLHYITIGLFAAMTVHGLGAGTDRHNPFVLGMYSTATGTVLVLLANRVAGAVSKARKRALARAAHAPQRVATGDRARPKLEGA